MNTLRSARLIAWSAFVLGVSASVAANVAHAKDDLGAQLASAFAPVALFLTVEIMSRVPWPTGYWWNLGRWAGAGTVALVAAVTSYSHMHALLLHQYGEDPFIAAIQPASVDGLMVVASLALLALGQHQPTDTPTEPSSTARETAPPAQEPANTPQATTAPARSVPPIPADSFARSNGRPRRDEEANR